MSQSRRTNRLLWSDPALFETTTDTETFLRRLLSARAGDTWTYVPWAQVLGRPGVSATVHHTNCKIGQLLVWYSWPSVYCVYQDGSGRWWFGTWFDDKEVYIEPTATDTD